MTTQHQEFARGELTNADEGEHIQSQVLEEEEHPHLITARKRASHYQDLTTLVSKRINNGQPTQLIGILLNYLSQHQTMTATQYKALITEHADRTGRVFTTKFTGSRSATSHLQWNEDETQHPWLKEGQRLIGNIVSENSDGTISLTPSWVGLLKAIRESM